MQSSPKHELLKFLIFRLQLANKDCNTRINWAMHTQAITADLKFNDICIVYQQTLFLNRIVCKRIHCLFSIVRWKMDEMMFHLTTPTI